MLKLKHLDRALAYERRQGELNNRQQPESQTGPRVCATCNGTGRVQWSGEDSSVVCPDCGGSTPKR